MKCKYLLMYCFFCVIHTPIYGNQKPIVVVACNDSSYVSDDVIRFGDVVDIVSNASLIADDSLKSIVIGQSAPPGAMRLVAVPSVFALKFGSAETGFAISFITKKKCRVYTRFRRLQVTELKPYLKSYLDSALQWNVDQYTVEIENDTHAVNIFDKPFEMSIRGLKNVRPRGWVRLSVFIKQDLVITRIPLVCELRVSLFVPKASRTIKAMEQIQASDVSWEKQDITTYASKQILGEQELTRSIATRTIEKGTIIHAGFIKQKPAIVKGDIVTVLVRRGNVELSIDGRARQEGIIGKNILVENIVSHKLLIACVVSPGCVEIVRGQD